MCISVLTHTGDHSYHLDRESTVVNHTNGVTVAPTFWKGDVHEYEFEYNDVTLDSHGGDLIHVTESRPGGFKYPRPGS